MYWTCAPCVLSLHQMKELAGREAALLTEVRQLHLDRKAWLDERGRLKAQA